MNEPQGYTQALVDILNSKLAQDIMAAYDQGAKDKEDAIIKLLEEHQIHVDASENLVCWNCGTTEDWEAHFKALIKGENK